LESPVYGWYLKMMDEISQRMRIRGPRMSFQDGPIFRRRTLEEIKIKRPVRQENK
jgi:hypothetical protein